MSLKSGEYPWCVCESFGNNGITNRVLFKCERCKEIHTFNNARMSIDDFVKISEAFCYLHKDCKENVEG